MLSFLFCSVWYTFSIFERSSILALYRISCSFILLILHIWSTINFAPFLHPSCSRTSRAFSSFKALRCLISIIKSSFLLYKPLNFRLHLFESIRNIVECYFLCAIVQIYGIVPAFRFFPSSLRILLLILFGILSWWILVWIRVWCISFIFLFKIFLIC